MASATVHKTYNDVSEKYNFSVGNATRAIQNNELNTNALIFSNRTKSYWYYDTDEKKIDSLQPVDMTAKFNGSVGSAISFYQSGKADEMYPMNLHPIVIFSNSKKHYFSNIIPNNINFVVLRYYQYQLQGKSVPIPSTIPTTQPTMRSSVQPPTEKVPIKDCNAQSFNIDNAQCNKRELLLLHPDKNRGCPKLATEKTKKWNTKCKSGGKRKKKRKSNKSRKNKSKRNRVKTNRNRKRRSTSNSKSRKRRSKSKSRK